MTEQTEQALRCLTDTTAGMAGHCHSWLLPEESAVPATRVRDPEWMHEQIRLRGLIWDTNDVRVLATLWWYSASARMIAPTIASLVVTGEPLSPELDDLWLHQKPDSRLSGVTSTTVLPAAPGGERVATADSSGMSTLATALGHTFAEVIPAVAAAGRMRERPLWALATDAIAGRLLWAGEAGGAVDRATRMARPLVAAIGAPMPTPRYTRNAGSTHPTTKRVSCCLLYRVPGEHKCRGCPGRPPGDRPDCP